MRSHHFPSSLRILLLSLVASFLIFAASLSLQRVVYENLLHQAGPWRFTGTALATFLTFLFARRWLLANRELQLQAHRRLQIVRAMNDKIRNALQVIQMTSYVSQPNAITPIREAVDAIDATLREASGEVAAEQGQEMRLVGHFR